MVQIETLIIKSPHCLMVQGHFFANCKHYECHNRTVHKVCQMTNQICSTDINYIILYNYFTINFLWNSSLFHISFLPYKFFLLWTPSMYVNRKSVKFSAISNWQPQTINGSNINLIEVFLNNIYLMKRQIRETHE